ncbi:hypothetical protein BGZ49_006029, partial [Haplosporangium sp. Z 27]
PPETLGEGGMGALVRCGSYELFDYILGYKFIQVSKSNFVTHDVKTAKIELAFEKKGGTKNQIEEYLDTAFGGTHKAYIRVGLEGEKTFHVSKDGHVCRQFMIVYMCGRPGRLNHPNKVKEYPGLQHVGYEEIKSSLF